MTRDAETPGVFKSRRAAPHPRLDVVGLPERRARLEGVPVEAEEHLLMEPRLELPMSREVIRRALRVLRAGDELVDLAPELEAVELALRVRADALVSVENE